MKSELTPLSEFRLVVVVNDLKLPGSCGLQTLSSVVATFSLVECSEGTSSFNMYGLGYTGTVASVPYVQIFTFLVRSQFIVGDVLSVGQTLLHLYNQPSDQKQDMGGGQDFRKRQNVLFINLTDRR